MHEIIFTFETSTILRLPYTAEEFMNLPEDKKEDIIEDAKNRCYTDDLEFIDVLDN